MLSAWHLANMSAYSLGSFYKYLKSGGLPDVKGMEGHFTVFPADEWGYGKAGNREKTGEPSEKTRRKQSQLPARCARRPGSHLPNGRQRVLGGVVAAAAVGDGGDAVAGPQHLQGPARGQRLEAEEAQQEVEDAGEEAGIAGAARHQQEQQQQEGQGAQEAPLCLPQPHARRPHRHGRESRTRRAPGIGEREARARIQGTHRGSTLQGLQRRAMAAAAAVTSGEEPAAQPIRAGDLQRSGAEPLGGLGGGPRSQARVPKALLG